MIARSNVVPELPQALIALRFYATGSHLQVIGNTFGIHISTVSQILENVMLAIDPYLDKHVHMPTLHNTIEIKQQFYHHY